MKKSILLILTIFFVSQIEAQISVLGGISTFSAGNWDRIMDKPDNGVDGSIGMDKFNFDALYGLSYSIPIPNVGMRIQPEINYTRFSSSGFNRNILPNFELLSLDLNVQNIAFLLNTNIYLLNLEGDCDCPTFGKDGGFFEKGFHIQGGPGVVLSSKQIIRKDESGASTTSTINETKFTFVIGAGLDIGLTDKFTITPFARYKWIAPQAWPELTELLDNFSPNEDNTNSISNFEVGVKLGFRYKN